MAAQGLVAVIEDDGAFRRCLRMWLTGWGYQTEEVAGWDNGRRLLDGCAADRLRLTAVVVDLRLPGRDGRQLLVCADALHPQASLIALGAHIDSTTQWELQEQGVTVLSKPLDPPEVLLRAIQSGSNRSAACVKRAIRHTAAHYQLTAREHEVLAYLFDGLRAKEIADRLGIVTCTAEDHIRAIREKLDCHGRGEVISIALGLNVRGATGAGSGPDS